MIKQWFQFFSPEGRLFLEKNVEMALQEDGEELTSLGIFAPTDKLVGIIRAKEDTLLAGLPIIGLVLRKVGRPFHWHPLVSEGSFVQSMTEIAQIQSDAVSLLKAERVILNYIGRLSGIANLTAKYACQLKDTGVKLLDTRKTTPGLRWLEKYAVQLAGGFNHRMNLNSMLMLKDNHIDAVGSIVQAVKKLRATYKPCPPIEVECRTLTEVREAMLARADRIMLDNMSKETLTQILPLIPKTFEVEVSGGVNLKNIREIALLSSRPPDFISVGRLTHSAVTADFSMMIQKEKQKG